MPSLFKGASVLVAGGAGFIGSNLIRRLEQLGANVRATLRAKNAVYENPKIDYLRGDLTRMEDCRRAVEGMDYVFMCAANTSGAAVIRSTPLVHVTPNVVMNAQILEASYIAKVKKFIWISSNAAYPPTGDRPVREEEMFNGDPYDAYFGVGWMKRFTEVLCRLYEEKLKPPMPTVVLRPSNIYGPGDDFDFATSHMLAALIRKVVERHDPLKVWGTGEDVRDLVYIDDMVDALILAAEKIDRHDAVNVALGKGYRVKDVLRMILDIDGYKNARLEFDPGQPTTIPKRLMDTTKAEAVLGFKAKTSLEEGLKKTIEWYRKISRRPPN